MLALTLFACTPVHQDTTVPFDRDTAPPDSGDTGADSGEPADSGDTADTAMEPSGTGLVVRWRRDGPSGTVGYPAACELTGNCAITEDSGGTSMIRWLDPDGVEFSSSAGSVAHYQPGLGALVSFGATALTRFGPAGQTIVEYDSPMADATSTRDVTDWADGGWVSTDVAHYDGEQLVHVDPNGVVKQVDDDFVGFWLLDVAPTGEVLAIGSVAWGSPTAGMARLYGADGARIAEGELTEGGDDIVLGRTVFEAYHGNMTRFDDLIPLGSPAPELDGTVADIANIGLWDRFASVTYTYSEGAADISVLLHDAEGSVLATEPLLIDANAGYFSLFVSSGGIGCVLVNTWVGPAYGPYAETLARVCVK